MVRFYLLPIQRVIPDLPAEPTPYRGPAYLRWRMNPDGLNVQWSMKDYGIIDHGIVAVNAEDADHAWLAAQTGVYQFPANLDGKPSATLRNAMKARLEDVRVPGNWISSSDTYRVILRTVTGMFLFMQAITGRAGDPFELGISLNTTYGDLPAAVQQVVAEEAVRVGYTSPIPPTATVRAILKTAADAWGATPILFGFVSL